MYFLLTNTIYNVQQSTTLKRLCPPVNQHDVPQQATSFTQSPFIEYQIPSRENLASATPPHVRSGLN